MKTLCNTCGYGLVLTTETKDIDPAFGKETIVTRDSSKCLLGDQFLSESVIACNRYFRTGGKITYYDTEYEEYAKKILEGVEPNKGEGCDNCPA